MKIYFKEVNSTTKQVDILRLIHDQLEKDPRFTTAVTRITEKISEYKAGNGFLPHEYTLSGIACIIIYLYDASEWEQLSQPRQKKIHALQTSEMSFSCMNTRSTPNHPFNQSTPNRSFNQSTPTYEQQNSGQLEQATIKADHHSHHTVVLIYLEDGSLSMSNQQTLIFASAAWRMVIL